MYINKKAQTKIQSLNKLKLDNLKESFKIIINVKKLHIYKNEVISHKLFKFKQT